MIRTGDGLLRPAVTRLFFKYLGAYYEWLMTARYERNLRAQFVQFICPQSADSLIEFGCGPGNFLEKVAPRCRLVYGVDASDQILRRAEQRLRLSGIRNVELIHSPIESFKAAQPCDLAAGVAFLYLFQNPPEILRKMKECVRPGGSVATLDPSMAMTLTNMKNFTRENKFSIKERYVLSDWQRAARFYRRFADQELEELYSAAGLESVQLEHTLNGMVIFAKGRRPVTSAADA